MQAGDTLESIAAQLWGDASFWYMIADANGLHSNDGLVEGMSLIIPNKIHNSHNSTDTWRVYDPNEAIGDTSPTAKKPPKKPKCGVFGQIVSMIVAVAASYFLGPVIGNAASQGFNNLIGVQKGFNWGSFALSFVAGDIAGGVGGAFEGVKSTFVRSMLTQATANAVSQGVGVATGLQRRFDFAGVAAAGIVSGVGGHVSRALAGGNGFLGLHAQSGSLGSEMVSGMAGGLAAASARSLITGTSFGDNIMAVLPSIIAQTVGGILVNRVAGRDAGRTDQGGNGGTDAPAPTGVTNSDAAAEIIVTARRDTLNIAPAVVLDYALYNIGGYGGSSGGGRDSRPSQAHAGPSGAAAGSLPRMQVEERLFHDSRTLSADWKRFEEAAALDVYANEDEYRLRFVQTGLQLIDLEARANAQFNAQLMAFGGIYRETAATLIPAVGVVDTLDKIRTGELSGASAAVALATLGKGGKIKAAEGKVVSPLSR